MEYKFKEYKDLKRCKKFNAKIAQFIYNVIMDLEMNHIPLCYPELEKDLYNRINIINKFLINFIKNEKKGGKKG